MAVVHRETLRVVQTVHDTVRDTVVKTLETHRGLDPAIAQSIVGFAAILGTIIFGWPPFWQWIESGLPPKVGADGRQCSQ